MALGRLITPLRSRSLLRASNVLLAANRRVTIDERHAYRWIVAR